jgi:hypothetical protein
MAKLYVPPPRVYRSGIFNMPNKINTSVFGVNSIEEAARKSLKKDINGQIAKINEEFAQRLALEKEQSFVEGTREGFLSPPLAVFEGESTQPTLQSHKYTELREHPSIKEKIKELRERELWEQELNKTLDTGGATIDELITGKFSKETNKILEKNEKLQDKYKQLQSEINTKGKLNARNILSREIMGKKTPVTISDDFTIVNRAAIHELQRENEDVISFIRDIRENPIPKESLNSDNYNIRDFLVPPKFTLKEKEASSLRMTMDNKFAADSSNMSVDDYINAPFEEYYYGEDEYGNWVQMNKEEHNKFLERQNKMLMITDEDNFEDILKNTEPFNINDVSSGSEGEEEELISIKDESGGLKMVTMSEFAKILEEQNKRESVLSEEPSYPAEEMKIPTEEEAEAELAEAERQTAEEQALAIAQINKRKQLKKLKKAKDEYEQAINKNNIKLLAETSKKLSNARYKFEEFRSKHSELFRENELTPKFMYDDEVEQILKDGEVFNKLMNERQHEIENATDQDAIDKIKEVYKQKTKKITDNAWELLNQLERYLRGNHTFEEKKLATQQIMKIYPLDKQNVYNYAIRYTKFGEEHPEVFDMESPEEQLNERKQLRHEEEEKLKKAEDELTNFPMFISDEIANTVINYFKLHNEYLHKMENLTEQDLTEPNAEYKLQRAFEEESLHKGSRADVSFALNRYSAFLKDPQHTFETKKLETQKFLKIYRPSDYQDIYNIISKVASWNEEKGYQEEFKKIKQLEEELSPLQKAEVELEPEKTTSKNIEELKKEVEKAKQQYRTAVEQENKTKFNEEYERFQEQIIGNKADRKLEKEKLAEQELKKIDRKIKKSEDLTKKVESKKNELEHIQMYKGLTKARMTDLTPSFLSTENAVKLSVLNAKFNNINVKSHDMVQNTNDKATKEKIIASAIKQTRELQEAGLDIIEAEYINYIKDTNKTIEEINTNTEKLLEIYNNEKTKTNLIKRIKIWNKKAMADLFNEYAGMQTNPYHHNSNFRKRYIDLLGLVEYEKFKEKYPYTK